MVPKILIAEDDPDVRTYLGMQLRAAGHDTLWAEDATSALRLCELDKPDLVLLDLGLAGGDGFLVLERLKSLSLGTRVIVLSGRDPQLNESHAHRLGAVAFLQKPVPGRELLCAIDRHLSAGVDNDAIIASTE